MLQRATAKSRIETIDLLRGVALIAMAIYHFGWDLEFFHYAEAGMTTVGGWKFFARSIASSFLFLVGVSLVLAHGRSIKWRGYWKRLATVVAAAAAITVATWFAVPSEFIFFGILHEIALASVLGLAFLRVPWPALLALAAFFVAGPHFLRSAMFDHPAWWWLGLSSSDPHSNDYVPVFPWFGAVLAGMAAARIAQMTGLLARMTRWKPGLWTRPVQFAGRHSLAFYLIHQPVLIGCVWLAAQLFPPAIPSPQAQFTSACKADCAAVRDNLFCVEYCSCMLGRLQQENRLGEVFSGTPTSDTRERLGEMAQQCTAEVEFGEPGGETQ